MDSKILNQILEIAFAKRVSDVHFEVDNPPFFRAHGQLLRSKLADLKPQDTEFIARTIMAGNGLELPKNFTEFDSSYALPNSGRFRVSVFKQRGNIGIVMRVIPPEIGNFADLQLPEVLSEIVKATSGLVLVTGPTGNGKSTTLASMLNYINAKYAYNIITIEDPIEFLFSSQKSCIIQREVGLDTNSYSDALKAALRMDPDVIMVGEMRDHEAIDSCIKASETGHLVFSTLHTQNAATTINRLISYFPPEAQETMRHRLADILVATVSLRLVEDTSGENVVPVVEVMRTTTTIQACIREGQIEDIQQHIEKGHAQYRMQSMDQHLLHLVKQERISIREAKRISTSSDLERKMTFT